MDAQTVARIGRENEALRSNLNQERKEVESAVNVLRDIAAMGRKAGSETAKNWLLTHGYALEEGGYVPGKGFSG